jgi:dihydrofolate reductase
MAKLIYPAITSLDGYVADRDGNFDWATPDEEVHAFVNELTRPVGTFLFGRRMYEVMATWEHLDGDEQPAFVREFAELWQSSDKIVFSRTLETLLSSRTRIEKEFRPERIRRMKAKARRDITVGGPELAAEAFRSGLVDECQLLVMPVLIGGGTRTFPDDLRLELELLDERCFESGAVYLHYRASASAA